MDIVIRHEREEDYKRVESLARDAFYNLYFPGALEHYVVHTIRNHKDFIPELTYVIEVDGTVQGACFYTQSKIVLKSQEELSTITFGPVFINPTLHRQSLGRKLITHTIKEAKALGYGGILTTGYTYHYYPYGFTSGKKYNISMEDGNFYKGLLALPLKNGYFDNISGYAKFSNALEVNEKEAEEFDKTFPPKEKKVQDSQKEFEAAASEIDNDNY